MNIRYQRTARGQAFIPVVLIAFLAVGVIGIFAFEICRAAIIRDQLKTATESAALAGSTALAGSSLLDPTTSHTNAMLAARSVFDKNDIFGVMLNQIEDDFDNTPAVNHLKVRMRFLDPKRNNLAVTVGDPTGKVLEVETKFGMKPVFSNFLGLVSNTVPIMAKSQGGVGDLDIALCFDVSGSMDDQTNVTRVRRRWDPAQGKIVYDVTAQGQFPLSHCAVRPQALNIQSGFNPQLRGTSDTAPPGNFPPGTATIGGFTDVVVNLDEKTAFAGLSQDGFDFPNPAALVEASRGNLENAAVFESSQAKTRLDGVVVPRPGYQAKYFELAAQHVHPLIDAKNAAREFFDLMNKNSNAHFALVTFNNVVGSASTSTQNDSNIATNFPAGGIGIFPLPAILLKKLEAQTNFDEVKGALTNLVASDGTNIGGSCDRAIEMFTNESRPNAKKAVIVFTDGEPTVGGPLSGDPEQNCILAAQKARTRGIAVYTVGLAQDPSQLALQRRILGDDTPQGMAKIAGNGSKFFPVTNAANLRSAFASIARQLSQLVE